MAQLSAQQKMTTKQKKKEKEKLFSFTEFMNFFDEGKFFVFKA
jgi:hypothetical protein